MVKIAVLKETAPGETRVSASPETVKKFIALGASVSVESDAGVSASIGNSDYESAGASVGSLSSVLKDADIILGVQGPDPKALVGMKAGAWLVAGLDPFGHRSRVDAYAKAGVDALAMEFMPRITRAQSMDILSSQSNLSGYKAVIEAASVVKTIGASVVLVSMLPLAVIKLNALPPGLVLIVKVVSSFLARI